MRGASRYSDEQLVAAMGIAIGEPLDRSAVDRGVRGAVPGLPCPRHGRPRAHRAAPRGARRNRAAPRRGRAAARSRAALRRERSDRRGRAPRVGPASRARGALPLPGAARPGTADAAVPGGGVLLRRDRRRRAPGRRGPRPRARRSRPTSRSRSTRGRRSASGTSSLTGNDSLPDEGVLFFRSGLSKLAEVELHEPRFFNLFSEPFVEETLDADIIGMREVYRDYGYLNAVVEVDRLEFSEDREWVTIHIAIDEGGRFAIGSLEIEGVEVVPDDDAPRGFRERTASLVLPEETIRAELSLEVGEIYERRTHKDDERALRRLLRGARLRGPPVPLDRGPLAVPGARARLRGRSAGRARHVPDRAGAQDLHPRDPDRRHAAHAGTESSAA